MTQSLPSTLPPPPCPSTEPPPSVEDKTTPQPAWSLDELMRRLNDDDTGDF